MLPPTRHARDTRGLELLLAAAGLACLAWWVAAFMSSAAYQASAARTFDRWRFQVGGALTGHGPLRAGALLPRGTLVSLTGIVGRIEIPSAGIRAMVAEGADDHTLARAVGHVPGSSLPGGRGRTVLAAHRDTYFRGLGRLRPGDEIRLDTAEASYRYRVVATRIVRPRVAEAMCDDRRAGLTLITCYPFHFVGPAPLRFIVSASPMRS